MTQPPPEDDIPPWDGSRARAAAAANPESGTDPAEAPPPHLPPTRLTSATRFAVRGLAEGAVAGIVTGVFTGFLVLVVPVGFSVVSGDETPAALAGWLYVTALYGVIFGALVGALAAAVLLAGVGVVIAVRPRALQWRGWPWFAGLLVAVAIVVGFIPAESYSTRFLSGDVVVGVTAATLAGSITVWRTHAALRSHRTRTYVAHL